MGSKMFRLFRKSPSLLLWPFTKKSDTPSATDEAKLDPGKIEFDRIKKIFQKEEDGSYSPELQRIGFAASTGFIGGSLYGGLLATARTADKFVEQNAINKYETKYQASRALQQKVSADFMKGSIAIGLRTSFFVALFQSIATVLFTYNGEMQASDYIIAGGLTGTVYKLPSGPRAAVAGTIIGASLGGIGAITTSLLLLATGKSMSDIYSARTLYLKELKLVQPPPELDLTNPLANVEETSQEPTA